MNGKTLKYIAYYADINDKEQRDSRILAAYNFINYECALWGALGYKVELISASRTRNVDHYYGRRKEFKSDYLSVL